MRRLLVLVTKNTSTLDYVVPLVSTIRRVHPSVSISVVYDVLARRRILRDFHFYSEVLGRGGVEELDLADTLTGALRPAVRRVFGQSDWDAAERRTLVHARRAIERRITDITSLNRLLEQEAPDTVLLDHRTREFPGRKDLDQFVERTGGRVVLLPHAPHHTGTEAFVPYSAEDALPRFCDYWMPFIDDRCWTALPARRGQFFYAGYPGFDESWLRTLRTRSRPGPRIRCAFIIRKVLRPGERRPDGHDAFVFDYNELQTYLTAMREALHRIDTPVEVVVKPHPSNDFLFVEQLMARSGLEHWSIARDSIYALLPSIDLAVSLYSTTLLATVLAGIPTILLHSRIQDEISRWPTLERLYGGLRYYLRDSRDLEDILPGLVRNAAGGQQISSDDDMRHVRNFFPDGALPRAMERLRL